jgi:hypothetical protein
MKLFSSVKAISFFLRCPVAVPDLMAETPATHVMNCYINVHTEDALSDSRSLMNND